MNLIARMAIPCLLASVAWAGPAMSADYEPPLVIDAPEDVDEFVPVEVGNGWYLRGDVGYQTERKRFDVSAGVNDFMFDNNLLGLGRIGPVDFLSASGNQTPVTGSVGFGYQFNEWVRGDVTVGVLATSKASATAHLESGTYGPGMTYNSRNWYDMTAPQPDYGCLGDRIQTTTVQTTMTDAAGNTTTLPATRTQTTDPNWRRDCLAEAKASHKAYNGMVNGYVDLGTFMGFTPYVGAGLGLIYTRNKVDLTGTCNNGNVSSSTSTSSVNPATGTTTTTTTTDGVSFNCDSTASNTPVAHYNKSSYDLMYGLSAGVAYQMTKNTSLDVGYQYLTAPSIREYYLNDNGIVSSKGYSAHQVKLGVRYALW